MFLILIWFFKSIYFGLQNTTGNHTWPIFHCRICTGLSNVHEALGLSLFRLLYTNCFQNFHWSVVINLVDPCGIQLVVQ